MRSSAAAVGEAGVPRSKPVRVQPARPSVSARSVLRHRRGLWEAEESGRGQKCAGSSGEQKLLLALSQGNHLPECELSARRRRHPAAAALHSAIAPRGGQRSSVPSPSGEEISCEKQVAASEHVWKHLASQPWGKKINKETSRDTCENPGHIKTYVGTY